MTGRDRIRCGLERAGSSPSAAPAPEFVERLDARLRARHGVAPAPSRSSAPSAWGRPRVFSPARLAAAGCVLVLAVALVAAGTRDGGRVDIEAAAPRLTSAVDVLVEDPDGRVVPGRPGLALVEGAVVRTGRAGRAAVDGVTIGPGVVADVRGGTLVPRGAQGERAPAAAPSRPPVAQRPPAREPVPSVASQPPRGDEPAPPPSTTSTTTTRPARPAITLQTAWSRGGVSMRWTPVRDESRAEFGEYVVLRAPGNDPAHPADESTTELFRTNDPGAAAFYDRMPGADPVYLVVVLDRAGNEMFRSNTSRPQEMTTEPTR